MMRNVLVTSLLLASVGFAYECVYQDDDGNLFDFTPLQSASSPYNISIKNNEFAFINLCGPVFGPSIPSKCESSAGCVEIGSKFYSIGSALNNDQTFTDTGSTVTATFSNGDLNEEYLVNRSMVIQFVCSDTVGADSSSISFVSSDPLTQVWTFEWRTNIVCGLNDDSDDYNYMAAWIALPLLCVSLILLIALCCCCCCRRRRDGAGRRASKSKAYAPLATTPSATTAIPAAGQDPTQMQQWFWQWNGTGYEAVPVVGYGTASGHPSAPVSAQAVNSINSETQPTTSTLYEAKK